MARLWWLVLLFVLLGCAPPSPVNKAEFDFSLNPAIAEVAQGKSLSLNIALKRKNGFAEAVEVKISPPAASGITPQTATVAAGSSATTVNLAVALGATPTPALEIPVILSGGGLERSKTLTVKVLESSWFSLGSTNFNLIKGQQSALLVSLDRTVVSGEVTVALEGTPPTGLSLQPLMLAAGASEGNLMLSTAASMVAGTYSLTIQAQATGANKRQTLSLTVSEPPSFDLQLSTSNLTIVRGKTGSATLTLAALNGFVGMVDLSLQDLPSGVTAQFDPPSLNGAIAGPLPPKSTLTLEVSPSVSSGSYGLKVHGISNGQTVDKTLNLTVTDPPSYDLQLNQNSLSIQRGQNANLQVSLLPSAGFSQTVALSLLDIPTNLQHSFTPNTLSPGAASSTLTFTVPLSVLAGSYSVKVRGTSSEGQIVDRSFSLTVSDPPDFQIHSLQPASLELIQGGNTSLSVSVSRTNLDGAISLTLQGLPTGVSSQTVVIPAGQTSTSFSINASDTAALGSVNLTLLATAVNITRTAPIGLNVKLPFELSLSKNSSTLTIGSNDQLMISLTRNLNFAGTINLSLLATPSGLSPSFNPLSLINPQVQSTLTLQSNNTLTAGTYALKVRASSGNFVVEQDLSLSANPASPPPTGKIWVLDKGNHRILGYTAADPNGAAPIHLNLSAYSGFGLQGLTMDVVGNLWFSRSSSANGQQGQVLRIPSSSIGTSGSPTPDVTITGSDFFYPSGIAFDSSGTLWVANGDGSITGFKSNRLNANYNGASDINIKRAVFANGATNLMFDSNQNMWVAASAGDRDTDDDQRFNPLGKKCSDRTGALVKFKPTGPSGYDESGFPWPAMVIGDESSTEPTPNNIYAGGYPCLGMNYDGRNVQGTTGVAMDANGGIWAANGGLHPDENKYFLSRFDLAAIEQNNCTHRDANNQPAGTACYFSSVNNTGTNNKIFCPEAPAFPGEELKYITPNGEWKCAATACIYLNEKPWGMTADSQGNLWVTTATKLLKFNAASLPTSGSSALIPSLSISGLSSPQGIYYR